ncbi:cation transporter [Candidatus Woesearchaeota archaeon]|nr:cation transporter [Candidatus Woesearchaeota archaeon]
MKKIAKRAALLGIFGNSFLFTIKILVGFLFNSLALISDAFNSLTDIIASVIVYISVKVSSKGADKKHPFGHDRAEPIAGLIVAIFTGILGFELMNIAFSRLLTSSQIIKGFLPMFILALTMVIKFGMYSYTIKVGKKIKSTAILASAADHKNDILVSFSALIGVIGANLGYYFLDSLVAVTIGFWIIKVGYDIGAKNVRFLIGEAPDKELMKKIKKEAFSVKGVKGVHGAKAHYVGVLLHVNIHITLDKKISLEKAHTIGKKVKEKVKRLEDISEAFVHIDPV